MIHAPGDYSAGQQSDVLVVHFTVGGVQCIGINGGDYFKHREAFLIQIATDDQVETDRYWDAVVGNGGSESQCGWCKDKWGVSWQITPIVLMEALSNPDRAAAGRGPRIRGDVDDETHRHIGNRKGSVRLVGTKTEHRACHSPVAVARHRSVGPL